MRASIIAVGSELLRGSLLDTNSHFFAQELQGLGAQVVQITQVPDDISQITAAIHTGIEVSDLIIVSGGLGPTDDDLTREAIIALTGEEPVVDRKIVEEIRSRFTHRGDSMPRRNEKQAWVIPSSEVIANPHGTAPGWFVVTDSTLIATLPGPPRENRPMWRTIVRSRIARDLTQQAIVSRTIKTIGIGESAVAERLAGLIERGNPIVATYAKGDGVHVTITAKNTHLVRADRSVRIATADAARLLNGFVYAFDGESLAAAVVQPLTATGTRLAVWESGTGGGFSGMLLSEPETQGLVVESRVWPAQMDGSERARDLARAAARENEIDTAVAVVARFEDDGINVVDGEVEVAFTQAGSIVDRDYKLRGSPNEIRRRSALLAAEFLWTEIRSAAGLRFSAGFPSHSSRI